jgi:hypothetical protein
MKNRLYLVLGMLLVAALGWAVWQALGQAPEPVYEGMPLSYWLTHVSSSAWSSRGSPVGTTWLDARHRGDILPPWSLLKDSNAVPFLAKSLKRDTCIGAAVYRRVVWPKIPAAIRKHLPSPADNPSLRKGAADCLAVIGLAAKPAVPALVRALQEDEDPYVRFRAANLLGLIGEGNQATVTALTVALGDEYAYAREMATNALLKLDPVAAVKAGVKIPSP